MKRRDHFRGQRVSYNNKNEESLNSRNKKIYDLLDKVEKLNKRQMDNAGLFKLYKKVGESLIFMNKIGQRSAYIQGSLYESLWNEFIDIAKIFLESEIDFFANKNGQALIFEVIKKEVVGTGKLDIGSYEFQKFKEFIEKREKNLKELYNIINQTHNIKLSKVGTSIREIAGNIVCYLGELKQWELKANYQDDQIQIAVKYYLMAVNLYPLEGRFFYLLSTCSHQLRDLFSTFYWAVQGKHCCSNFDFHDDLQQLLQEIENEYQKGSKFINNNECGMNIRSSFKQFALGIINIYGKIQNKISIDNLRVCSVLAIENQDVFLENLTKSGEDVAAFKQLNQSSLILNACHFLAEKYDKNSNLQNWEDISTDTLRETIKAISPMIAMIFQEVLAMDNYLLYLESILPLFYYLRGKNYLLNCILFKRYKLCEAIPNIIEKIKSNLEKNRCNVIIQSNATKTENIDNQEFEKEKAEFSLKEYDDKNLELMTNGIIEDELIFIYFEPQQKHYSKKNVNLTIPKEGITEYVLRVSLQFFEELALVIEKNLVTKSCDNINVLFTNQNHSSSNIKTDFGDSDDLDKELMNYDQHAEGNPHLKGFQIGKNIQDRTKTQIVIDGRNIAIRYGENMSGTPQFKTQGILCSVKFWHDKGHPVMVILPDYCFNEMEVEKRRSMKLTVADEKTQPDDVKSLIELKNQQFACGVPNWDYDDSYILEFAKTVGGYIVTNDRFKDHLDKYSGKSHTKRAELKKWLKDNCISFSFIGRVFMPNPDFLKEHNIR